MEVDCAVQRANGTDSSLPPLATVDRIQNQDQPVVNETAKPATEVTKESRNSGQASNHNIDVPNDSKKQKGRRRSSRRQSAGSAGLLGCTAPILDLIAVNEGSLYFLAKQQKTDSD